MRVKFKKIEDSKYHISKGEIEEEYQVVKLSVKDPSKFQLLYDKYFEVIFNFIFRRTDDEDITADITSQVFFNALKNLKKYKFKGVPFSAWLYRIASNEIANYYKRNKRKKVFSLEEEVFQEIIDDKIDEDNVSSEIVVNAMKILSEGEAEVLELRFFEDKAFAEIAYILDISEASAKMRTYRAIEKLKRHLNVEVK